MPDGTRDGLTAGRNRPSWVGSTAAVQAPLKRIGRGFDPHPALAGGGNGRRAIAAPARSTQEGEDMNTVKTLVAIAIGCGAAWLAWQVIDAVTK